MSPFCQGASTPRRLGRLGAALLLGLAALLVPSIGYAKFKLAADADPKNPPGFEMGFAPGQAAFRPGDDVFVAATDPGATPGRLAAFGARSRLKLFEMEIPHSIDAMAYTPSGNVLLVLGQADGVEFVTRLQLSDAEVVSSPTPMTYRMPRTLTRPSLVIDRDRAVLVGEATSNRLLKIPASEFQAVPLNARPAVSGRETELGFAYLGVHALGVAAQTNLVIVSQEASPTITRSVLQAATARRRKSSMSSRAPTQGKTPYPAGPSLFPWWSPRACLNVRKARNAAWRRFCSPIARRWR